MDDDCNISLHHLKNQLNSEIQNMTEKCATWDKIAEQTTLPDEIQEEVLAAVGHARLLMAQKMQQFASLVRCCELPEPGQALVTTGDLQGFWDMVLLQIENIEIRFKKLEQARARGWVAEQPEPTAQRQRRPAPPPKQPARAARPPPTSSMKDIIAAARRAKKADTGDVKTFEAGFFSVQTPVKSPATLALPVRAPATPLGLPSLLKSVLSSEAKASAKKSSYAILRASSISKQVDSDESPYEGNQIHMPPINWNATPGKSILISQTNPTPKSTGNNEQVQNGDDDKTSRVHKLQDAEISADPDSEKSQNIADDTSNAAALATDKFTTEEKENRLSEYAGPARKGSYTQSEADSIGSKRKRLTEGQQHSVDGILQDISAASKPSTSANKSNTELLPSKSKAGGKVLRTKLPIFTALHQKRFAKMESLDECQERQLLTLTGSENITEREAEPVLPQTETIKTEKPKKSIAPQGYTRFGFKLDQEVNPFSIPAKTDQPKPKTKDSSIKPTIRRGTLPSVAGPTSARMVAAKQVILREKSSTDKRDNNRNENRTVIKCVRTNRRFELQMKLRNV
ncbi:uncharacterized protein LOC112053286 isoform X2 [Bicyclus anynana]|uniref:Uncharacterized protein LOC112053286 isoform X2 n=1 Tax=Bicyclus anynana TaxID=110368 RepID=A0ABM3M502_BICAN|nr:uncharacterized protein LOC112053286 isoform X2 [Bicyclus anynana]